MPPRAQTQPSTREEPFVRRSSRQTANSKATSSSSANTAPAAAVTAQSKKRTRGRNVVHSSDEEDLDVVEDTQTSKRAKKAPPSKPSTEADSTASASAPAASPASSSAPAASTYSSDDDLSELDDTQIPDGEPEKSSDEEDRVDPNPETGATPGDSEQPEDETAQAASDPADTATTATASTASTTATSSTTSTGPHSGQATYTDVERRSRASKKDKTNTTTRKFSDQLKKVSEGDVTAMAVKELGQLVRRINPLDDNHSIDSHLKEVFEECAKKIRPEGERGVVFSYDIRNLVG